MLQFTANAAAHTQVAVFTLSDRLAMALPGANPPVPPVQPRYDFPYAGTVLRLLSYFLGVIAITFIALFFVGLLSLVQNLRGNREGGAGRAVAGMVASLIAFGLTTAGTISFYSLASNFS